MKMQYPLPMARGCPYNCPYCGGGSRAQRLINGRTKVILRSPEKVVEDIQTINSTYKVNGIFFGHGIYPGTFKYWKNLFQLIRKEKMDIGSDLEIWRLPFPKEIWPLYARTFNPEISSLGICPRSLSPRVQQKVRETCDPSYNFPKRKIQDLIQQSLKYNIILRIWFTIGFPFQTRLDLLKDYLFTLKLALKYGSSKIFPITVLNDLVTIIPGSPAFESPGTYEVSLTFNSFPQIVDMYKKAKFVFGGWNSVINYQNKYMTNIEMRMWNRIFNATELPMFINSTH